MRKSVFPFILILGLAFTAYSGFSQINTPSTLAVPFGSNTSYTGSYILPFNLPVGGQYGNSKHAAGAYNAWKSRYTESCGGSPEHYRVLFDVPSHTVSEGIGYGMLLAAYAGDKVLFDGLWTFYRHNLDANGLMHWKIDGCYGTLGFGSATDGDLDAALALVVAGVQWGISAQPYDYNFDAFLLISRIMNFDIQQVNHPGPYQTNNGDSWSPYLNCRNPGYFSPAWYRVFSLVVPSPAWDTIINTSYALLQHNAHPITGLVSNWCDTNGTPNSCHGPHDYGWDACRNPWRMGVAAAWFSDTVAINICQKVAGYVRHTGVPNLKGPVPQSGGTGLYHHPAYISTWAAGIVGTGNVNQGLLDSIYTETVNTIESGPAYFGNTLRVLSLFLMTGNFWMPQPITTAISKAYTNKLSVYPNPARDFVIIHSQSFFGDGNEELAIFGLDGRCWKRIFIETGRTRLNIEDLPAGLYFLRIRSETGVAESRMVKW